MKDPLSRETESLGDWCKSKMSLPNLAAGQGQNGGWERATLSFPCRH